jgi:MoaF C-terminal domain/MoaF N-terminal domain
MAVETRPKDWKNYNDFALGIATNRLPGCHDLVGRAISIVFDDGRQMELAIGDNSRANWRADSRSGFDAYETIMVAPEVYFVDLVFADTPAEAETLILDFARKRALSIRSIVREPGAAPGEPRVVQVFRPGVMGDGASSEAPQPTRDLIGLTAHYDYSPNHVYEHIYLSSTRYCWQCLKGVQRGHGDVDLATTYKFGDGLYVFTFREFIIPVASTFFYNLRDMRSTGKFLGVASDGRIVNSPAGATIRHVSRASYEQGQEPV